MRWVINLNGDSKETLANELWEVYSAADRLIDKLRDLTVNGRNYPNSLDDLKADQEERLSMVLKAEEVRRWAQNEMLALEAKDR